MNHMTSKYITVDSDVLSGTPVFAGTRVPLDFLFDYLEAGDSIDEFLSQYPGVSRDAVIGVLEIARKTVAA